MKIEEIIKKMAGNDVELLNSEEKELLKGLNSQSNIHDFLKNVTIDEIVSKADHLKTLNFKKMGDEEMFNAISNAISFDSYKIGMPMCILKPQCILFPSGTQFFRIRTIKNEARSIPVKFLSKEQDIWNAPEELCTAGRLNKEGESLLYTSVENPDICVEEMNVKDDDWFCLIAYKSVKDIKSTLIGIWKDSEELSKEDNLKMRMITNVLKDLFVRDVGKGTEFLYRVSERIAKDYFDLPRQVQDSWCYPSVAAKLGYNVCFRPDVAREVLQIANVQVCSIKHNGNQYEYTCYANVSWNSVEDKYEYERLVPE